jgi:hypothetical protein
MKIRNWCKNVAATLVAAGVLSPSALNAASLGVNLVVNGNFENVNTTVTGNYNGPLILDWTGPNLFAYSHNGSTTSAGVVPDYADGADPPNAGNWYFTANNTGTTDPTDVRAPGVYYQDIVLSSGPSAALIAGGAAEFNLSAYMSSYLNDADFGNVQAEFRNAANVPLATALITDAADAGPNNVWNLSSTSGLIPIGTASVRLSLFGTPVNAGADAYIDNVDFRVVPEPASGVLAGAGILASALKRRSKVDVQTDS